MQLGPQELQRLATLACLLAARLLPLGLLLPWLAPRRASLTWRVACTLALTLALLPLTAAGVREGTGPVALLPALGLGLVPHVAAELLRGGVLAFAFALPLYAFDWAGELAELVRAPSAVLPDDHDAGPLRQLQYAAALAIFFASGSHRPVLAALAATLQDQPLGAL
ncbi:MAG TPA: flagellar biosynthetic protein FliR, partial [Polyangiales bacterium]|nr:flagellar biosynthetic protein FliR [Polyangiales bacterium]